MKIILMIFLIFAINFTFLGCSDNNDSEMAENDNTAEFEEFEYYALLCNRVNENHLGIFESPEYIFDMSPQEPWAQSIEKISFMGKEYSVKYITDWSLIYRIRTYWYRNEETGYSFQLDKKGKIIGFKLVHGAYPKDESAEDNISLEEAINIAKSFLSQYSGYYIDLDSFKSTAYDEEGYYYQIYYDKHIGDIKLGERIVLGVSYEGEVFEAYSILNSNVPNDARVDDIDIDKANEVLYEKLLAIAEAESLALKNERLVYEPNYSSGYLTILEDGRRAIVYAQARIYGINTSYIEYYDVFVEEKKSIYGSPLPIMVVLDDYIEPTVDDVSNNSKYWIILLVCGTIVTAGGAVTFVVLRKKRKKKDN